jgi:hypothetical protein
MPKSTKLARIKKFNSSLATTQDVFEVNRKLLMLQENLIREGARISAEMERMKGDVEAIKTACMNQLERVARTHRPFTVTFVPNELIAEVIEEVNHE